jgi:hypothetical protein
MAMNYTMAENMSAGIGKVLMYNKEMERGKEHFYIKTYKIGVGAIVFFLGITRTIHLVGIFTPISVVRVNLLFNIRSTLISFYILRITIGRWYSAGYQGTQDGDLFTMDHYL